MTDVAVLPVRVASSQHCMAQPLHDSTSTTTNNHQTHHPPSTPPPSDKRKAADAAQGDVDDSELSELETPPRPKPKKMDHVVRQKQVQPAAPARTKKARAGATSDPIQLKNGKLVLKQKPRDFTTEMSVLTAIVRFNEFCKLHKGPLTDFPPEHDVVIARVAQESDKSLTDLAKDIRNRVIPANAESQQSETETTSDTLPLALVEAAIERLAERTNYGLSLSDVASSSTANANSDSIPAPLQLWRWEVRDTSLLQPERVAEMLARREERKAARQRALELFNALQPAQQEDLLAGKKKGSKSATTGAKLPSAAPPTAQVEQTIRSPSSTSLAAQLLSNGSGRKSTPHSPAKAASEAGSRADSGIVIDDDDDDDDDADADDEAAGGSNSRSKNLASPERRKSADSNASPKNEGGNTKVKKRAKLETLTPEQIAERERKELEKDEKRKVKEAKDAKKQKALEATKKSASLFTGFFNKKPAAAVLGSPVKQGIAPATISSPSAVTTSDFERTFIPAVYKDIAPINRFQCAPDLGRIDRALEVQDDSMSPESLVSQISRSIARTPRRQRRRMGIHPPINVRETMRLVAESDLMVDGDGDERARKALLNLKDRRKVPIKLLQFATDLRPGWFGTWTRPSNMISGRTPLRQDPVALDYNYDSEAEWVEGEGEERGEEVGDDNDDLEEAGSNDGDDSEMDDWLVDDLEEIEGEGEETGAADEDDAMSDVMEVDSLGRPMSPSLDRFNDRATSPTGTFATSTSAPKRRRIPLPGLANKKRKLQKQKRVKNSRRFTQKLVPVIIGPHWQEQIGQPAHSTFAGYEIEFLNGAYPGLDPFTFVDADPVDEIPAAQTEAVAPAKGTIFSSSASKAAPPTAAGGASSPAIFDSAPAKTKTGASLVPTEHLSAILQAVEGSTDTKLMLQEKLALQFKTVKAVTKAGISATLTQTCEREGKKSDSPWRVKSEWRSQAGLT